MFLIVLGYGRIEMGRRGYISRFNNVLQIDMGKEADIERVLVKQLDTQLQYTYRPDIKDRAGLEANFRKKFEELNRVSLTDSEFKRLREDILTTDVFEAAKKLRQKNTFERDDKTQLHYTLVNIEQWCKNDYEVVNQLRINTENSHHRFDVLLLMNGIPVVQIELKAWEVSPRKAMQQIVNYKADPGNGYTNTLLCYVQLFIVSNEGVTYYFANNRKEHFNFNAEEQFLPVYRLADRENTKISNLYKFAEKFLAKCTLGEMIGRYMVLVQSEHKILIMRPYQIYAVKDIIDCIEQNRGNGFVWHTTGSGKTLTSFKASTLLKDNADIEKCLFVVDRKDLDRQTREEFNKFQEGCVEQNTNTGELVRRMLSEDKADKVIVTTIQKLALALTPPTKALRGGRKPWKDQLKPLSKKRVVFIFDECHRSQFGDNHRTIKEFFPKAQFFGFTGTPIFEENSTYKKADGTEGSFVTTKDIFDKPLHQYTITHAIEDDNVLRFHIDYYKPDVKTKSSGAAHRGKVVDKILAHHDAATDSRKFNALMATASINDAIAYYELFKERQAALADKDDEFVPLNIACVFSPPAEGNRDVQQLQEDLDQEKFDNQQEPERKKEALKVIIDDYNRHYGTSHRVSEFDQYYQDVQKRIKDQQWPNKDYAHKHKIDVTIVVDMLLTGFDSKYLNTLYVDKNLRWHGLIQAFSRTNRTLNDTKPYGNVMDFRQQQAAVDEAIARFSGDDKKKPKEIWLVDPAPEVVKKFETALGKLDNFMKQHGLACTPEAVGNLKGDEAKAGFINAFKEVQRYRTQLEQYTDLGAEEKERVQELLPHETLRSFRSVYMETAQRLKALQERKEDVPEAVGQLDFEFVLFASALVDYDYIMRLISRFTQAKPTKHTMTRAQLVGLLSSHSNMMEERDDIIAFVNTLEQGKGLGEDEIKEAFERFRSEREARELTAIAERHGLGVSELQAFVNTIMNRMIFDSERLGDLLAPLELGWKDRTRKELALMEDLLPLLHKQARGGEISGLETYA